MRVKGDIKALMKKVQHLENIDLKGANLVLAETLKTSTIDRFKHEESPSGKPWQSSLRADHENGKTLTKSGLLRRSIKSTASSRGFAVGTNKIYARTHQLGEKGRTIRARTSKGLRFKIGGRWITKKKVVVKIPKRPFLGVSEDDMKEIRSTLMEVVAGDD